MYRSKSIIRELSFMICLFLFSFDFPDAFLVEGELAPAVAYVETFENYIRKDGEKENSNL